MCSLLKYRLHPAHVRSGGFTLIELMIVVAIIGILAAIAMPSYKEQVRKTRRADAQSVLYDFANAMERYASKNPNTGYADAATGDADSGAPKSSIFPTQAPLDGNDKYYNLTLVVLDEAGGSAPAAAGYGGFYTLSAAPASPGAMAGDACGTFSLTSAGTRSVTGSASNCWK
ncbi:MAG: type IV pilin protein [Candidatus Sedimenticola sp. (ex Thyasira tokunagai)]